MGTFGDRMRREREMRGVTLEEISESTKISKRALQALEEEDFDLLPGGIFNKGFVRAYARFLGIDEEQAVADFVATDAVNHAPEEENKFPLNIDDRAAAKPPLNPKRSFTPVLLAMLLLAMAAGGWTFWNKRKAQHSANESQAGETSVPAAKSPEQLSATQATPANSTDAGATAVPAGETTSPTDSSQKSDSPSAPASDSNSPSYTSAADDTAASTQPFTILIKATEDSWISIVADGKQKVEGTLNSGKQRSVTAGKELVLLTGNAGGIEVSYNGKPIAPLGKKQQRKSVTFTPQGLKE